MFTNLRTTEAILSARQRRSVRAFTLMEVVIALTILGMITGTLFSIIQGSVKGAAQIEQIQRENDAINRFLDLCRKTFTTLPSTATLELTLLDPNSPASGQELTISGSPNCFGFGINPISYKDTILGLRPDPNGATDTNQALVSYLCLSREDLIPQTDSNGMALRQETTGLTAPDDQGRYWMPLLPDVVNLKWRFFKDADDTWLEEWNNDAWPDLIEIQLVMRDRTAPLRMVYSLPTLLLVKGNGSTTANTSSSQGGNNSGGGGGRQGQGQGGGGGQGSGKPNSGGPSPNSGPNPAPSGR